MCLRLTQQSIVLSITPIPDRAEFESFSSRAPDCHRPSGGYSARLRRCSRVFTSANSLGRPNSERGYVRSDKPVRALWRAFEPTRPHQKFCRPSCRRAAFTGREQQPPTDDRPARAVPHAVSNSGTFKSCACARRVGRKNRRRLCRQPGGSCSQAQSRRPRRARDCRGVRTRPRPARLLT